MSLAVTALTEDPEVVRRLHLLGIDRIDEMIHFTCDELVWQFGEEGKRIWERILGKKLTIREAEEGEPLKGEWELFGVESLRYSVKQTFDEVVGKLTKRERRLRSVRFLFRFERGDPAIIELRFSRGAKGGAAVFAALEGQLKFEEEPILAEWEVAATFRMCAKSLTLFPPREEERRRRMVGVLEELKGRRDPKGIMEVVWDAPDCRIPERRAHLESLVKRGITSPLCTPVAVDGVGEVAQEWEITEGWWTEEPIERRYVRDCLGRRFFYDRLKGGWFRQ